MKALVFEQYGKAKEVLKLQDIPQPEPQKGEVKVKMLLSPLNPSDVYNTIEGTYKEAVGKAIWNHNKVEKDFTMDADGLKTIPSLPHIPGLEGVGIVVSAGSGIYGKMLIGKRVTVVGADKGNWQEYNVVAAKQALPVNKALSDEQAATSFVNPVTAYIMIKEELKCKKGDFLLQSAGNSEVGKMVIKLGKYFGFKTINLVRNINQKAALTAIGADYVLDVTSEDVKTEVYKITAGKGVRCALDPLSGELPSNMIQCLGVDGTLMVYGTLLSEPLSFSSRDLMTPLAGIKGFFLTNWMAKQPLWKKMYILKKAGKLVKSGVLASDISQIFELEDFQNALMAFETNNNKGKILLKCSNE
jgi:NADPH:quinone reductase-like Zn-dependent oxidoreductase